MRHILRNRARGTRRSTCRAAVLALGLASVAACNPDDLLESDRPSTLEAEDVAGPSNAALLVNGAVADFECAHGAFVAASGLMRDALEDAQLAAAVWSYDRRDFGTQPGGQYGTGTCNAQLFGVYRPLATARWSADNAIK